MDACRIQSWMLASAAGSGLSVLDPCLFASELSPRGDSLLVHVVPDRAAWLGVVSAIVEAAIDGGGLDVSEGPVGAVPKTDLADPGRVDQQCAARQGKQLADDCRMSSTTVVLPDRAGGLPIGAEQRVRERRLAGSRCAQQHCGRPARQYRAHCAKPFTSGCPDGDRVGQADLSREWGRSLPSVRVEV